MAYCDASQLVSDAIDLTRDTDDDVVDDEDDDQPGVSVTVPLPGFDPEKKCALCKLYARTGSHIGEQPFDRDQDDAPLGTKLLETAASTFHQIKVKSRPSLVDAYTKEFCKLGTSRSNLAFLKDVTYEEVYKHYDEDHEENASKYRDPMVDTQRTLQIVLKEITAMMCVKLKKGRNKNKQVPHPERVRLYLDVAKTYHSLFPKKQ